MTSIAYETYHLGWRSVRRFFRVPSNWIGTLLFPLVQLFAFSQLFKDIVQLPGFATTSYLAYLTPGQIIFAVFFATAWSGMSLLSDYRSGYLDKLRASPITRASILWGELAPLLLTSAFMGGSILGISILLGVTVASGLPGVLMILALSAGFGLAWSGTSFVPALITKNEQAAGTLAIVFIPLAFLSTAYVPVSLMPDWLQAFNRVNPVSYVIEALRSLITTGFDWPVIGRAIVAILLLGLFLQAITFWAFRRLTN